MKVLLPIEYYPPHVMGGAEISAKLLAEGLAKEGIEVHVLTPDYDSFSDTVSERKEMYIHRFRSIRKFLWRGKQMSQVGYRKKKALYYWLLSKYIRFSAWEFARRILKLHERENFNLVHAQNLESILGLSLSNVKCPKIAHIRDFGLFCINRGKSIRGKLCDSCSIGNIRSCVGAGRFLAQLIWNELIWRRTHLELDHYIAVSDFVAGELKKEGIQSRKISVIYNPIDNEEISHLSKEEARKSLDFNYNKVALFVGSLTEAKGVHLLLKLAKRMPDVNFVVVGDGPLRQVVRSGSRNIHYHGQIPHEEVKHYLRATDVLVVPSLWHEPFGRVAAEGQMNSAPVIASKVGALPEILEEGKAGLLAKPGDVKDWSRMISKLMEDENLKKRLGKRVEKNKQKFNPKITAKAVLEIYNQLAMP